MSRDTRRKLQYVVLSRMIAVFGKAPSIVQFAKGTMQARPRRSAGDEIAMQRKMSNNVLSQDYPQPCTTHELARGMCLRLIIKWLFLSNLILLPMSDVKLWFMNKALLIIALYFR